MKTLSLIARAALELATDAIASAFLGTIAGALVMFAAPALAYPVAFVVTVSAMTYLAMRDLDNDD